MKINFTGDIGIFRKYEELNIDPFEKLWLPESDINIGNFEFIVSEKKNKLFYDVQNAYSCSADYLKKINIQRFHGLGLANNHSLDYGLGGARETIGYLKSKDIQVFGFSENSEYTTGVFEVGETKVCIIGCVKQGRWSSKNFGYGPNSYDTHLITNLIKNIRKECDHVIVYPHWGTELIDIPNQDDTIIARQFIDAGATAVIGNHPHVPQGIEEYGNGLIAYSLGSFIYIHEDELGYSDINEHRHVSICINIELSKKGLEGYKPYYYKYDAAKKIPLPFNGVDLQEHIKFMNENIHNKKLYKEQIRKILLKREFSSFVQRFRKDPLNTVLSYSIHAIKRVKKLF